MPSTLLEAVCFIINPQDNLPRWLLHPHLQMKKWRLEETKCLIHRFTATEWQRPDSNPGLPTSYPMSLMQSLAASRGQVSIQTNQVTVLDSFSTLFFSPAALYITSEHHALYFTSDLLISKSCDPLRALLSPISYLLVQPVLCWTHLVLVLKSQLCTFLPNSVFNDVTMVAWNQLQWEYLHHRNRNKL